MCFFRSDRSYCRTKYADDFAKRDVEDTGFPEPKYEVWGFSDTVPYG